MLALRLCHRLLRHSVLRDMLMLWSCRTGGEMSCRNRSEAWRGFLGICESQTRLYINRDTNIINDGIVQENASPHHSFSCHIGMSI